MRPIGPLVARGWPIVAIVGCAVAATWPLFVAPGMPYNVDVSGFFPLTPEAYEDRFWPLWNERGGMSTAQFLPALLLELPLLVLGSILGFDMAFHIKLRILLGLVLAGVGMYALVRHYLRRERPEAAGWLVAAVAFAPAAFFMLNPWSIHRIFHYFLWTGYVLAPWVVLAFERFAESPRRTRALALAAAGALATTDPHNPPYLAFILAPLALVRLASVARRSRDRSFAFVRGLGLAAGAYLALCAFWILPYVENALHNRSFGPTYVMSDQMLGVLSQNADLLSVLRLMHNYLPRAAVSPAADPWLMAWTVASFAVPILAVHALILRPRPTVLAYGAIGAACVVLGMGSTPPFTALYRWLLFDAPWGEGLSWLFRDPYRWGGAQAFVYAVLMGFAAIELALLVGRLRPALIGAALRPGPAFIAAAAVGLFVVPGAVAYMTGPFAPVIVPNEYAQANTELATMDADAQVVWMPRMLGATTWSGPRTLSYFDATSSARPALGPFRPHTSAYFDLLADSARSSGPTSDLLSRAGIDTVVFHNDRDPARDAWTLRRLEQSGLRSIATIGESPTRLVDGTGAQLAKTPSSIYAIYDNRTLAQTFVASEDTIQSLSLTVRRVGSPPPLELSVSDGEGQILAKRATNLGSDATEVTLDLSNARLVAGAEYELRAQVSEETTGPDSRYNISYYTVDAYPQGALAVANDGTSWKPLAGDVRFTLASRTRGFVEILESPRPAPRFGLVTAPVVSPGGLELLPLLATLPEGAALREASVAFTASPGADGGLGDAGLAGHWVSDPRAGELERVAPMLGGDVLVAPFHATTSAAADREWARGTPTFTYYDWGWRTALSKAGVEDWSLDGGHGLVYTSAKATLSIPVSPLQERTVILARVYESPAGGKLAFVANTTSGARSLATFDTNAATPTFRWLEVGTLPADATSVRLDARSGLQGVNLLALVPEARLLAAKDAARAQLAGTPVTLIAEAQTLPGVTRVDLPGVGSFGRIAQPVNASFLAPREGSYQFWVRTDASGRIPNVTLDGRPVVALTCSAECDTSARWYSTALGDVREGEHVLTMTSVGAPAPLVGSFAITTDDAGMRANPTATPAVGWDRVDATRYTVRVEAGSPALLAFASPYDAGWTARVDGQIIRSTLLNGVTNGFVLPAREHATDVEIVYEPQRWADLGALVTGATILALAGVAAWRFTARPPEVDA